MIELIGAPSYVIIKYNDKTYIEEFAFIDSQRSLYVMACILKALREFFSTLPLYDIKISYALEGDLTEEIVNIYKALFYNIQTIINNTNELLTKYKELKDRAKTNKNILFYLPNEDIRPINYFNSLKLRDYENIILKTYETGWNPIKRVWECENNKEITIDQIIDFITKEEVKKIVFINETIFTENMQEIFMPAFLEYIGLENCSIEYDQPEYHQNYGLSCNIGSFI